MVPGFAAGAPIYGRAAPKTDKVMTERLQEALQQADFPPEAHGVDAG
jgi:hypothetical protein